jgi:hypothetical protein
MAKPKKEKECAEATVPTCGEVRKMILKMQDDIEKKEQAKPFEDRRKPPSIPQIILSILQERAEEYFKRAS